MIKSILELSQKELQGHNNKTEETALEWIGARTRFIQSFLVRVLDLFKQKNGKTGFDDKIKEFLGKMNHIDSFKSLLLEWFSDKLDANRLIPLLKVGFQTKTRHASLLKHEDLSILISDWLCFVFKDTAIKVQSLLDLVESGVELAKVRDGVLFLIAQFELEKDALDTELPWFIYAAKLLSKEVSFWTDLYQPCFSTRFSGLILTTCGSIFNSFSLSLEEALNKNEISNHYSINI